VCARNVNNEIVFYEDNNFGIVFFMHVVQCTLLLKKCHCQSCRFFTAKNG